MSFTREELIFLYLIFPLTSSRAIEEETGPLNSLKANEGTCKVSLTYPDDHTSHSYFSTRLPKYFVCQSNYNEFLRILITDEPKNTIEKNESIWFHSFVIFWKVTRCHHKKQNKTKKTYNNYNIYAFVSNILFYWHILYCFENEFYYIFFIKKIKVNNVKSCDTHAVFCGLMQEISCTMYAVYSCFPNSMLYHQSGDSLKLACVHIAWSINLALIFSFRLKITDKKCKYSIFRDCMLSLGCILFDHKQSKQEICLYVSCAASRLYIANYLIY